MEYLATITHYAAILLGLLLLKGLPILQTSTELEISKDGRVILC